MSATRQGIYSMTRRRAIAAETVIALAAIVAALVMHDVTHDWAMALAVALFAEILLQVFRFRVELGPFLSHLAEGFADREHPFALLTELSRKTIPLELLANRPTEGIFQDHFDDLIAKLQLDLEDLAGGHFVQPMQDVQDISFKVCNSLKQSAFCTAPQNNLGIFNTPRGRELKQANFAAATKLEDKGGFTRLFVFEDLSAVSREHYLLMEENELNKVKVLVALTEGVKRTLRKHGWEDRVDFGLWDDQYLITITSGPNKERLMEVSNNGQLLDTARGLVGELEEIAWTWGEFSKAFTKPVNEKQWASAPGRLVEFEPPNGPADDDCEVICRAIFEELEPNDRIALYGLTKRFIDKFEVAVNESQMSIGCDIVDSRADGRRSPQRGINYINGNWIEWEPPMEYRVIVGDDVIPNLGIWQVPMFFKKLAEAIPPGGRFITRTAVMSSSSLSHPTFIEALNRLRTFDPGSSTHDENLSLDDLTEGVVYEVAWPALHSADFFEPDSCSVAVGKWDQKVKTETDGSDFKGKISLPYNHVVTCLDYAQLEEFSAPYFHIVDDQPPFCVWENTPKLQAVPGADAVIRRFRNYYRILTFERGDAVL